MEDIIIIGGGTAGLTAAIYSARAGMSVLLFESDAPGGKIINSPRIDNYPAMPGISGFDYSMALLNQTLETGTEILYEKITGSDFNGKIKKVFSQNNEYEAKSVIIANGAFRRKLGCKGETEFEGRGVSYCATCDGNFFKGMDVAVIGGGDTAAEDALYLSGICRKVYVFTKEKFTAGAAALDKIRNTDNIVTETDSSVTGIHGDGKVEKITVLSGEKKKDYDVSAVFIAVGISPDNSIFGADMLLSKNGYIIAGEDCHTSVDGVFAAGDTRQKSLRQLVTAAADGAVAATEALKYIKRLDRNDEV